MSPANRPLQFNLALDTFYSHAEQAKLLTKHSQAQTVAHTRLTAAQEEHEQRISALRNVQEENILKASLIESNLGRVEEALRSVNGLLERGMDWGDIERLISMERENGNVVAEIIVGCHFGEGKMVLALREDVESEDEEDDEEDSGEEGDHKISSRQRASKAIKIEVDLGLSAWANAREYFDKKKVAAEKVLSTHASPPFCLESQLPCFVNPRLTGV